MYLVLWFLKEKKKGFYEVMSNLAPLRKMSPECNIVVENEM